MVSSSDPPSRLTGADPGDPPQRTTNRPTPTHDVPPAVGRRAVLASLAGGLSTTLAGCSLLSPGRDAPAVELSDDRARSLAKRFAPTIYFDSRERWFPTDPRPYRSERDGQTIVDGFDALDGYVGRRTSDGRPPDPVVFYHALEYEDSSLAVVQFWLYSAFDQFATNFHWHDWELLQVFVDTESGDPQLYVASSHSRSVPNNEHLDPDPSRRPRILAELGSHSSGLSVNDDAAQFQRLPSDGDIADITNDAVEGVADLAGVPLAYGLPRDEQLSLPYLVPELDGRPVYEDDRLPNVERSDLVPEDVTVRSLSALSSPPDLPRRETGLVFGIAAADADVDVAYDLVPTAEVESIDAFTGPQLSFEFAVPEFAEDAVADHVTTAATPWSQPRYREPASDVTETDHRQALADRYDAVGGPAPVSRVVARVTNAVAADEAPDGEGLTTTPTATELFALVESEATAVPTFRGIAVASGVPDGEHRLTVNGPGVAPHAETVSVVGPGTTVGGVDGEIPLVPNENARKLLIDPGDVEDNLTDLAVEDDFAGRLYDAPLSGPDAVYVHRGGAYTTEVRDADGGVGAARVTPDPTGDGPVRFETPRTGAASLATYVADLAAETRDAVAAAGDDSGGGGGREGGPVDGLSQALDAVATAARRAAERAAAGDRSGTEKRLQAVTTRLDTVASRLSSARNSLPAELGRAVDRRLDQARRRTGQARRADTL